MRIGCTQSNLPGKRVFFEKQRHSRPAEQGKCFNVSELFIHWNTKFEKRGVGRVTNIGGGVFII